MSANVKTPIENRTIEVKEQELSAAVQFLASPGFRASAELQENGRKKRRTASEQSWSAETGEILIRFKRIPDVAVPQAPPRAVSQQMTPPPRAAWQQMKPPPAMRQNTSPPPPNRTMTPPPPSYAETQAAEISELCSALNDVEQQGRSFVALKWFRDDVLVARGYSWANTAERRQGVLTKAIESGAVLTNKIQNPKAPLHPTTTVRLNRSSSLGVSDVVRPRFRPIPVRGEMVSTTLLRDRGAS